MKNGRPRGKDDGHVAWAFFAIDGSQIAFESRLADWGACRASDEATCSAAIFCQRTCEVELLMFHDPHAAKGILVGVLGVLAVHYGYSR